MEATAGVGLSQQCSSCDESSARCWCLDCNEALCDACVSAHRRVTVTRCHRIQNQPPAGGFSSSPTKFCKLHPSEPLKLFCFTCNQLTCRDCQLMNHMNHRYQFVSEALAGVKKELEVLVQPIRANRDKVRQSLQDMEIRLQDIAECESQLRTALRHSFSILFESLRKRMDDLLKEAENLSASECGRIQMRMTMLKSLQQKQQSATEAAAEAQRSGELTVLLGCRAQIESQLKELVDQNVSPPPTMSNLRVITDRNKLISLLNFGELQVSWIPFSVSPTSNQKPPAACVALPQTWTTCDIVSPVSVNFSPDPAESLPSSDGSVSVLQTAPPSLASAGSHLDTRPAQVLLQKTPVSPVPTLLERQPASVTLSPAAVSPPLPCLVLGLNRPVLVSNQPPVVLTTSTQRLYQVSSLPRFPMMLSQTKHSALPRKKCRTQKNCGSVQMLPVAPTPSETTRFTSTCPSFFDRLLPPTGTTNDDGSGGQIKRYCASESFLTDQSCPPPSSSLLTASSSSSVTPPTTACLLPPCETPPRSENTCDTDTPVQDNCPSVSSKFSSAQFSESQPRAPRVPMIPTVTNSSSSSEPNRQPTDPECCTAAETVAEAAAETAVEATVEAAAEAAVETAVEAAIEAAEAAAETAVEAAVEAAIEATVETTVEATVKATAEAAIEAAVEAPERLSPVVRAVADSACDVQRVAVKRQETEENEPTSTVSEETEPAGKTAESEECDRVAKETSSLIGHCKLSQWQPRVSLTRLPASLLGRGQLPAGFSPVPAAAGAEMHEDAQSLADDITDDETELPSSPECPVTLQIVTCSACGAAYASIICSACGRGFHRACHVPPIGPDMWSEWTCSLCQDLSDPSDPYSSERPQRALTWGPRLSVLDQRRCESLLLKLMVEGCGRLSQFPSVRSGLKSVSERLAGGGESYRTAAEFLSDVWKLLSDASQDDDLQETFQSSLMETFTSELHHSVQTPQIIRTSATTSEEQEEITIQSKLYELRKRLRDFLGQGGAPHSKRMKMD